MAITNEAVDMAAAVTWARQNDGTRPSWNDAMEDARWVDEVEETREATRIVLEAAEPQLTFDILMAAANDIAGDTHTSLWDKINAEFKSHDGERVTPEHESYLDGIEESREFLYERAHEIINEAKQRGPER